MAKMNERDKDNQKKWASEEMDEGSFYGQDKMVAKMKSDQKKKGLVSMRKTDGKSTSGVTVPSHMVDEYKAKGYTVVKEAQITEGVLDDMDDDGFMAKRQLYDLAKQSVQLHRMIEDGDDLEPWVQSKITMAADYIDTVKHYMEYKDVDNAEAMVDFTGMDDIAPAIDAMGPQDAEVQAEPEMELPPQRPNMEAHEVEAHRIYEEMMSKLRGKK